jgi:DNA-binding transcriptional ArsR family regulator
MNDQEAAKIAKALSNPIRIGFLLQIRDNGPLSPSGYTRISREPIANVAYHVNVLEHAGLVGFHESVTKDGKSQRLYTLTGPRARVAIEVIDHLRDA